MKRSILISCVLLSICPLQALAISTTDRSANVFDRVWAGGNSCNTSDTALPVSGPTSPIDPSSYKAVGNIPASGEQVGASTYGGSFSGGSWTSSNNVQGGKQPYDDNGIGYDNNGPLAGKTAYAELGNGSALGNLPNHTKLAITYNGKTIIAEKLDIGGGGGPVNGKPRAVDLWWETAKLLNFTNGTDVLTIHGVDNTTQVTPLSGSDTTAPISQGTGGCCDASGGTPIETDLIKYLQAEALQENGGKVTGGSAGGAKGKYQYIDSTWQSSAVKLYPPASKYSDANAAPEAIQDALAYINFGYFFKQEHNNMFKVAVDWFYPAANSNPSLLDVVPPANVITPRQYANQVIAKYKSGAGSSIPFKGLDAPDFAKYVKAQGLQLPTANGAPLSTADGTPSTCQAGATTAKIVQTALKFAWPDTNDAKHSNAGTAGNPGSEEPAYYDAWTQYDSSSSDTTDCGAYVATVIIASGADPNYPKVGTSEQMNYVQHSSKYQIITNAKTSADLQPGDILIQNSVGIGHTEMFVGPQPNGYSVTDASLHGHTPDGQPDANYMLSIKGMIVARYVGGS